MPRPEGLQTPVDRSMALVEAQRSQAKWGGTDPGGRMAALFLSVSPGARGLQAEVVSPL